MGTDRQVTIKGIPKSCDYFVACISICVAGNTKIINRPKYLSYSGEITQQNIIQAENTCNIHKYLSYKSTL
jgi:hypothetical protein